MFSIRLVAVGISALFLLIVGLLLRFADIFFMATALLALPVVSYAIARLSMRSLACTRELPEFVHEDEPIHVKIGIQGNSKLLGPIDIVDTLPAFFERLGQTGLSSDIPGEPAEAVYSAVATARGEFTVGPLQIRASDPLGFFVFSTGFPLVSKITVLPSPLELMNAHTMTASPLAESDSLMFDGKGTKGSGLDFHGVREYNVGDDLRRVHWRSTARRGRLSVVEFEEMRLGDTIIGIDLQKGSEYGSGRFTTLEYAVKIGAGIARNAMESGGMVRLAGAGVEGRASELGRGVDQLYSILESLARVRADREESLATVMMNQMEFTVPGSRVLLLVSSVDEELIKCAQMLSLKGISVQMIIINLSGDGASSNERAIHSVLMSGISFSLVECSVTAVQGTIRYEYAA